MCCRRLLLVDLVEASNGLHTPGTCCQLAGTRGMGMLPRRRRKLGPSLARPPVDRVFNELVLAEGEPSLGGRWGTSSVVLEGPPGGDSMG